MKTKTQNTPLLERIGALPRVVCGSYPTPLEELRRLRHVLGPRCPRLFIKRDDYTGTAFGSNKLRKLDFAIAAETIAGTECVVTIGGERSNHARVTAAICAKFGIQCILILDREADRKTDSPMIPASQWAFGLFGAEIRFVESRADREPAALVLVAELQQRGIRASYLPLGVSFPLGAIGFVNALAEMKSQFGDSTEPDFVFHASTSGGTQAGLVAGCPLLGMERTTIIGVSPDDSKELVSDRVARIANGVFETLGSEHRVSEKDVVVLDQYVGEGYGKPTDESKEAALLAARTEAVILDQTYTGKAFAAVLDWIRTGRLTKNDTVLFWHTGGQLAGLSAPG